MTGVVVESRPVCGLTASSSLPSLRTPGSVADPAGVQVDGGSRAFSGRVCERSCAWQGRGTDIPSMDEIRGLHEKYAPPAEAFNLAFTH
ncbi:hypothetical protein [Streptomyces wuyuanensis]|uniref:hypothetical protein n=1 Tax=Streptomyces wuyuanensis TaxID=1196353 RepID=UPI00379B4DE9